MELSLPKLEPRLQRRYQKLVLEHLNTSSAIAAGPRALPGAGQAFASTQGAWRFFANPQVTLQKLAQPLKQEAHSFMTSEGQSYGLVVHDWSDLSYDHQALRKGDQIQLGHEHHGYEMHSALLLGDLTGMPLTMLSLNLTASDGLHSTESELVLPRTAPLDQVSETMAHLRQENFPRPLVHLIDREGDSIFHLRWWHGQGDFFLIRANDYRYAVWEGHRWRLREIARALEFQPDKVVEVTAELQAQAFIAATTVTLIDPAHRRARSGRRQVIRGEPLTLRLVVVQLRLPDETVYAEWYLLTHLPADVLASTITEWYYWRWTIESMHKLLKSAGRHVEQWQQETAAATAKRLLVSAQACVVVWQVQRTDTPQMEQFRKLLWRLSGRQIRPGQATAPALLSGLWTFLALLDALQCYDLKELFQLASLVPVEPILQRVKLRQGFSP